MPLDKNDLKQIEKIFDKAEVKIDSKISKADKRTESMVSSLCTKLDHMQADILEQMAETEKHIITEIRKVIKLNQAAFVKFGKCDKHEKRINILEVKAGIH